MKTRWTVTMASVIAVAMLLGCGANEDAPQGTDDESGSVSGGISSTTPVVQDAMPEPGSGTRELGSDTRPIDPADAGPMPDESAEPEVPAEPAGDRVKAEVGVGQAGRSLDEYEGVYVTPAKAYFGVREKIVFTATLPKAMQLYEALNGKPKTHEEFMTKVVEANNIPLPELPPGQRYVYDPEKGELMVERPR